MRKLILFIGVFVYWCIGILSPMAIADTQSVNVTGTVAPHSSDFQLALSSNASGTLPQNTPITYTITYGSHLLYADAITLEAYWTQGTLQGDTTPSIDGLDYVTGSASNAYGSTQPVINLTSQKISWTISSFPASSSNNTITFQLKTNGSYTGNSPVTFPVKVRLIATNYIYPYQSNTVTYQYASSTSPTPTPNQSGPTTVPTSTQSTTVSFVSNPTPTSSIKPSSLPFQTQQSLSTPSPNAPIQDVSIVTVSDSNTQIALSLNKTASAIVSYGLSPNLLTSQTQVAVAGSSGLIDLSNLDPDTTYYMQVATKDQSGKITKSEVFSVQTAQISAQPQVAPASLVVASDNDVLYSAALSNQSNKPADVLQKPPQIPVAQDTNYSFAFKLTKANKIKSVSMTLANTSVLGVSNFHPVSEPLTYSFPVFQKDNGVYGVQITNPTTAGNYDVYLRITDYDGNITTQKIATLHVLKPFRVLNALSKKPIEDARIVLSRLNEQTNKYELLPNIGGISNPLYTNSNGEVSESLPKGAYKANFGRIGYVGKNNVTFSLGINPTDDLPTIYLTPTAITPLSIFVYYRNAFTDYVGTTSQYIAAMQQSYRYFDLVGLLVIFCFIIMTLLLFRIKTHIRFAHLPVYFHHHFLGLMGKESDFIHGIVQDKQSHTPLIGAEVFLIDERTKHILSKTTTNAKGSFLFPQKDGHHAVTAMKEGYELSGHIGYTPDMKISLQQGEKTVSWVTAARRAIGDACSLFFEFMLVISVILEIVFFPAFGIMRTIPGILASLFNILLWIFYLRERDKDLTES